MADRRPWTVPKLPPEARLSVAAQRAQAFRASSPAELRAFLRGLQISSASCLDVAEELYERADRATSSERADLNGRAAAAKACAGRIDAMFDAAARAGGERPARHGIRALIRKLAGHA